MDVIECTHPGFFSSMCVRCGKKVDPDTLPKEQQSALTISGGVVLQLSVKEAEQVQASKVESLKKMRKLALVLDLDHTLLHAVLIEGPCPTNPTNPLQPDIFHLPIEEFVNGTVKHLVMKKRPFLDSFLAQAHEFCQMTVYTAGTRRYAEAVVKILDPQGKFINNRIVARTDDRVVNISKSLQKIFLNDSSMAVILDDREDVWKGAQSEQLLLVRPYIYFHSNPSLMLAEVNNLPGMMASLPSNVLAPCPVVSLHSPPGKLLRMAPQNSTEFTEADDQLPRCLHVLRGIHAQFYGASSGPSPSVARILNRMKSDILAGCVLVFSGIIPVNEPHPEQHMLYKLALSLGASVVQDLTPSVTHLICVNLQTRKAQSVLSSQRRVFILHPDWLIYCKWALARVVEETFSLAGSPVVQAAADGGGGGGGAKAKAAEDERSASRSSSPGSLKASSSHAADAPAQMRDGIAAGHPGLARQIPADRGLALAGPGEKAPARASRQLEDGEEAEEGQEEEESPVLTPKTKKRRLAEIVSSMHNKDKKTRPSESALPASPPLSSDSADEADDFSERSGLAAAPPLLPDMDTAVSADGVERDGLELSVLPEAAEVVDLVDDSADDANASALQDGAEDYRSSAAGDKTLYEEDYEGDGDCKAFYEKHMVDTYEEEDDYTRNYHDFDDDEGDDEDYGDTRLVAEGSFSLDIQERTLSRIRAGGSSNSSSSDEEGDFEGVVLNHINRRTRDDQESPMSRSTSNVSIDRDDSATYWHEDSDAD